ncbi:carboxylesterase [Paenibacillus lautus]|uniref:carboxylesterase/lipase family protein n=1 Tax=Paenibacillus lautus TaxID=1401 RepID=UPI001B0BEF87|nr:carboxylesterase family protein [Paenibacillus lautus]GIP01248.1 carboxylesterase [Paenibacillus lautus]
MIVQTLSGKVAGVKLKGSYVFRGIPYAAPPIGKRRFKPPAPSLSWSGVRQCNQLGPIAPQKHNPQGCMPELVQSEDCLNLNVWTSGASEKLKPVMVYIHGGGFVSGMGAECDGSRYAAENGIVYVSINYRLGALGFLYLGGLLGKDYETSGNNGMLDIAVALQWVQFNITAFGGDPSRVTVIGNSAGAKCTAALYVMKATRGLFHQAIAQSGATQSIRDCQAANVTTLRLLEELGLSQAQAHQLLELPAEKIIEAQSTIGSDTSRSLHMFGPVSDGHVIPVDPLASLTGSIGLPPLLIGTNEDEAAIFIHDDPVLQSPAFETLERLFGANAAVVWDAYGRYNQSMSSSDAWNKVLTEHLYTIGAMQFAEAVASSGTSVWMYRLQCGGTLGAIHGYEGSLIHAASTRNPMSTLLTNEDPYAVTAESYALAGAMRKAWVAFTQSGDPNIHALPAWPVYGSGHATMVLDKICNVRDDLPVPAGIVVPHQVWRIV